MTGVQTCALPISNRALFQYRDIADAVLGAKGMRRGQSLTAATDDDDAVVSARRGLVPGRSPAFMTEQTFAQEPQKAVTAAVRVIGAVLGRALQRWLHRSGGACIWGTRP